MARILTVSREEENVVYLDGWVTARTCPVCGKIFSAKELSARRFLHNGDRCDRCRQGRAADYRPLLYHSR